MKKIWIIAGVIGILALIAGGVGLANAQASELTGQATEGANELVDQASDSK